MSSGRGRGSVEKVAPPSRRLTPELVEEACRAVEGAYPSSPRDAFPPHGNPNPGLPGTQVRDCRQDAGATEACYPLILAGPAGSCRVVLELNLRRMQERVVNEATTHDILDAGAMLVIQL